MIRFLRAMDLVDYAGAENQINFCLFEDDCSKVDDVPVLEGLTPPAVALSAFERSRKTDADLKVFENAYKMILDRYSSLVFVHGIVDLSNAGVSFNFVVNSSPICKVCVDALTESFMKLTRDVEVLL